MEHPNWKDIFSDKMESSLLRLTIDSLSSLFFFSFFDQKNSFFVPNFLLHFLIKGYFFISLCLSVCLYFPFLYLAFNLSLFILSFFQSRKNGFYFLSFPPWLQFLQQKFAFLSFFSLFVSVFVRFFFLLSEILRISLDLHLREKNKKKWSKEETVLTFRFEIEKKYKKFHFVFFNLSNFLFKT